MTKAIALAHGCQLSIPSLQIFLPKSHAFPAVIDDELMIKIKVQAGFWHQ